MKKSTQALKLAHALYKNLLNTFNSFAQALKFAWQVIKTHSITFVKERGEIRTASIEEITYIDRVKGFARFVEKTECADKPQYRSFRFERVVVCSM